MELIFLSGYTEEEKLAIALRHVLPRSMEDHGLTKAHITLPAAALQRIIVDYTREAGLRQPRASRSPRSAARWPRKFKAERGRFPARVTPTSLQKTLGTPRYRRQVVEGEPEIGVVTGLAWTVVGGETLPIEAAHMTGAGKLKLTGNLKEVMKESAETALSFARTRCGKLPATFMQKNDLHIHVPEGAVPKDGPSAGIAMATAIVSLLREIPVRKDVAMTGEITLRGKVLAVGGIKEKVLAADRAGIRTVLLPAANEADLAELPPHVRRRLRIVHCRTVDDVFREALGLEPAIAPPAVETHAAADAAARC
jgi:ATP-dependent Lon protease